jgi:ferredoxin-type protein NapH
MASLMKINITYIRRVSQVLFFVLILYGGFLGFNKFKDYSAPTLADNQDATIIGNDKDPRLDLYLPIRSCKNTGKDAGVFKGCGMFMMSEVLTYETPLAFAVPILFLFGLIFLFGRLMCGWACPMGFFQEILDWLRGLFRISYYKIPRKITKIMRKIRYGWLMVIFLVSLGIALPFFSFIRKDLQNINCQTCPTRYALWFFPEFRPTFMSFNTPFYGISSAILIVFLIILGMSFIVRRFWCRLCPNGAFLSLFNKGCLTSKIKDLQKCTKCGICYEICPMDNEDVYEKKDRKVVNSKNCVMCFECVNKCPETDCLKVKFAGGTVLRSKYK